MRIESQRKFLTWNQNWLSPATCILFLLSLLLAQIQATTTTPPHIASEELCLPFFPWGFCFFFSLRITLRLLAHILNVRPSLSKFLPLFLGYFRRKAKCCYTIESRCDADVQEQSEVFVLPSLPNCPLSSNLR